MKIIKEGIIYKQVTCDFCGCIYEFDVSDIKEEYSHYGSLTISTSNGGIKYVECPCCKNKHRIINNFSGTVCIKSITNSH